ncbi:helix-turn-helix domain-containing protein [Taibaiella chishuiensis]|uniref:AraC-like DNA-binding protein n=1 Tax=Taibaiella chishuiensis TaxID=1434707 RepID=A0A2P8D4E3_9BACT|nr:helix-turn-helix domain-containing protein [Taibaiella chishuiensis]PSK92085.1 AraC-like DNA-binding protein [Taibaiella chishuiensis]
MQKDFPVHQLPLVDFLASDQSPAFGPHVPSHRINFYAIVWFLKDGGKHYIDFEEHAVRKNSVYLIGKNQIHSIPATRLPHARTIVFSTTFFDHIEEPYLRQLFFPFHSRGTDIPADMLLPMKHLFELIMLESNTTADRSLLLKYTTILLTYLLRFSKSDFSALATEDNRMLRLFQLLEANYQEHRPASFYARQIGLTPKRVNEILRQKMGTTINGLLNRLLLLEAKRELSHQQYAIKEIAYKLGFSDQSYFARFFKKHTGMAPERFRDQGGSGFGIRAPQ